MNQNSVSMAPPVTKPGHPPNATAPTITRETDVICALKGSEEPGVRNVPKNTTEMIAVMITFLLPANEVWGKVICLQVSVCPQGDYLTRYTPSRPGAPPGG